MGRILNVESQPVPGPNNVDIELVAVLTVGDTNHPESDRAVYLGAKVYEENNRLDPDWVYQYGRKLNYDEAVAYFPHIEKGNYRK